MSYNGHTRGTKNFNAKLDAKKVRTIRTSKKPVMELAERYHVSKYTIYLVRNRKTWRHVV